MRPILVLFVLLFLVNAAVAQYTYKIMADTVKITNPDSSELIIENHTQGVHGFLFNKGRGRTEFRKVLMQLDDSTYLLGVDTLHVLGSSGYWQGNGPSIYNTNPGMVGIHRSVPQAMLDLPGSVNIDDSSAFRVNYRTALRIGGATDSGYTTLYSGDSSGLNNAGTYVTIIGNTAGVNNSGSGNTFMGYAAGHDNTGSGNTLAGMLSGRNNSADSSGNLSVNNSFLGVQSGENNSGSEGVFLGYGAGNYNYGSWNLFGGENAGNESYGQNNTFFGVGSGSSSSGNYNACLGYQAGYYNTGSSNLLVGNQAGFQNQGSDNIIVGNNAANSNRGSENVILGDNTAYANGGNYNVILGNSAGEEGYNSRDSNVFIGYSAGLNNFYGSENTAIGSQAGFNIVGSRNTLMGARAGNNNNSDDNKSDVSENTIVGALAGENNSTSGNTIFGACSALNLTHTGTPIINDNVSIGDSCAISEWLGGYNTMLGASAGKDVNMLGDHCLFVGYQAGAECDGDINNYEVFLGSMAGYVGEVDGDFNIFAGDSAGYNCGVHTGVTLVGGLSNAGVNTDGIGDAMAIGYKAVVNASNTMVFGDTAVRSWLFGINSAAGGTVPGAALVVGTNSSNGNGAYLTSGGVWTNASDMAKKEDFESLDGTEILDKIDELPISSWNYKGVAGQHIGPVAQDFYRIFRVGENDKTISTIDPSGVALAGIEELYRRYQAVIRQANEQQSTINEQQSVIAQQQGQIDDLLSQFQQQNQEITQRQDRISRLAERLHKLEELKLMSNKK